MSLSLSRSLLIPREGSDNFLAAIFIGLVDVCMRSWRAREQHQRCCTRKNPKSLPVLDGEPSTIGDKLSLSLPGGTNRFFYFLDILFSLIIFLISGDFLRRSWGNRWVTIGNLPEVDELPLVTLLEARTHSLVSILPCLEVHEVMSFSRK